MVVICGAASAPVSNQAARLCTTYSSMDSSTVLTWIGRRTGLNIESMSPGWPCSSFATWLASSGAQWKPSR